MVSRPTKSDGGSDFELTPAGTHRCTLQLKDCEVFKWAKTADGKGAKTEEKIPGVRFCFKVENQPWFINTRGMNNSLHARGGLFKMMQECSNSLLKEIEFDQRGWAVDPDLFFETMLKLQDFHYEVKCEHNEYNGRTYANFVSCDPQEERTENVVIETTIDEDEIPF